MYVNSHGHFNYTRGIILINLSINDVLIVIKTWRLKMITELCYTRFKAIKIVK